MPVVKMPDGALVNMPDNPTPEQLAALQEVAGQAKPSVGGEALRVVDQTVRGGVFAAPNLVHGLIKKVGEEGSANAKSDGLWDRTMSMMPASLLGRAVNAVTPKALESAYEFVTTPSKPQTPVGRVLGGIGESTVAALTGPGALKAPLQSAVTGASAGAGSETAAAAFGDNAVTRIVGAILGGGVPALASKFTPNSTNIIRKDMSALDDQDMQKALTLRDVLNQNGMQHSATQLFGPKSTLADTFQEASANQFVRPRIVGKLADARDSATTAVKSWQAQNLPPTGATSRGVPLDVQKEAEDAINKLKGQANQAYTAALPPGVSADKYSPQQIRNMVDQLRTMAKDPAKYGSLSSGGPFMEKLAGALEEQLTPGTILGPNGQPIVQGIEKGYVNNLIKDLNTRAEKEGYKGLALEDAKWLLKRLTPEYNPARQAKADFYEQNINPVQQGLAGDLARMGGGVRPDRYTANDQAITRVISHDRAQPAEIAALAKDIGPDQVTALLQEHLSRAMNSAVKPTTSVGAKVQQPFAIQGNARGEAGSALRENVDASLRAAATSYGIPAAQLQGSFHKIMDALESYKDLKLAGSVDKASIQQAAGRNLLSAAVAPLSRTGRYIQDAVMARTYRQIADLAMKPDGAELLIAIAKSKNPNVMPAFLNSINDAGQQGERNNQP